MDSQHIPHPQQTPVAVELSELWIMVLTKADESITSLIDRDNK